MLHLYLYRLLFRKRAANKNWVICLLIVSFFMLSMLRETLLYTFLSDINKRITYAWTYFLNQNCHLNSFKRNQTFQNRFCKLLNIYNLFLTKKKSMQLFHYGICSNFKRKNTKVKKYKYCERKRTSEHLSNCLTILNIHKLWQLTNYSYTKVFRLFFYCFDREIYLCG